MFSLSSQTKRHRKPLEPTAVSRSKNRRKKKRAFVKEREPQKGFFPAYGGHHQTLEVDPPLDLTLEQGSRYHLNHQPYYASSGYEHPSHFFSEAPFFIPPPCADQYPLPVSYNHAYQTHDYVKWNQPDSLLHQSPQQAGLVATTPSARSSDSLSDSPLHTSSRSACCDSPLHTSSRSAPTRNRKYLGENTSRSAATCYGRGKWVNEWVSDSEEASPRRFTSTEASSPELEVLRKLTPKQSDVSGCLKSVRFGAN